MINSKFLLVQGRALPQTDSFLQRFPDDWELEFPLIEKLGFYGIEWIYDELSEYSNPILTKSGIEKMKSISKKYQVKLENIVFDWFLKYPLLTNPNNDIIKKLVFLIEQSKKAGFSRIILPLLEGNSINSPKKFQFFKIFFREQILESLVENNIEMHFETDLNSQLELNLLESLNNDKLKICFDMGNNASYGYDPNTHIEKISNYLGSVHVKDRKLNGGSFPLGKGDVQFPTVFHSLNLLNFNGPISFQVYRDKMSDNISVLKTSLSFISDQISLVNCGN